MSRNRRWSGWRGDGQTLSVCLVQSLGDVRDQIGRVFDADRQPDRGVENTYFWRMSAGTPEWVMLAGRLASDSVPPRLTASLMICSAFRNLNAASWPPRMSNENVEPAPLHCLANTRPAGETSSR